jgi:hypothetical protein
MGKGVAGRLPRAEVARASGIRAVGVILRGAMIRPRFRCPLCGRRVRAGGHITSRFASASTSDPPVRVQICAACAADIDQIQKVYDVMLEYQRALKASVEPILSQRLRP